jgi:formate hydrogenlyase subunit 6/NADH:ubiquinone oxidoreductase subunit I
MKRPGRMISEVLRSVLRKPATVLYPRVKVKMPDRFRGKLIFHPDKCVGCRLCMRDCPTDAIQIRKVGDKQFEAEIDMARCICCGQCVDSCLKKALEMTAEFELAQLKRETLKLTYSVEPKGAGAKASDDKPESDSGGEAAEG